MTRLICDKCAIRHLVFARHQQVGTWLIFITADLHSAQTKQTSSLWCSFSVKKFSSALLLAIENVNKQCMSAEADSRPHLW